MRWQRPPRRLSRVSWNTAGCSEKRRRSVFNLKCTAPSSRCVANPKKGSALQQRREKVAKRDRGAASVFSQEGTSPLRVLQRLLALLHGVSGASSAAFFVFDSPNGSFVCLGGHRR